MGASGLGKLPYVGGWAIHTGVLLAVRDTS